MDKNHTWEREYTAPMDARAILHDLTYAEGLPREAIESAHSRRAELAPVFLAEIEGYLAAGPVHTVNSSTDVVMMESAKDASRDDTAHA